MPPTLNHTTTAFAALLLVGAVAAWSSLRPATAAPRPQPAPAAIRAELRSWVVAGRGRHLFLQFPPQTPRGRAQRLEFTSAMLRSDYRYTQDASSQAKVARMRGGPLRPPAFAAPPDNRLENIYDLTPAQVRCLLRDRVFSEPYVLLGANSNAAMRRVIEQCGCALPERILQSGGWLGEFPGIDADVGDELPIDRWPDAGIPAAPTAPAAPP